MKLNNVKVPYLVREIKKNKIQLTYVWIDPVQPSQDHAPLFSQRTNVVDLFIAKENFYPIFLRIYMVELRVRYKRVHNPVMFGKDLSLHKLIEF